MKNTTALLALLGLVSMPTLLLSQEAPALPRIALTEAPQDDPVFDLTGEFVGPIAISENKYEPLGLQIRAIGADRFEAIQYKGGLPGQKTFVRKQSPVQLMGQRSEDFVVLSGGPWAIFVESDHCLILNRQGKRVGRLERIARSSPTMGAQPPKGANVLFDGTNTEQFTSANMTDDGLLKEGATALPMFQDFDMHVEFRLPYMPNSQGQKRGNSGCYLQSRYEVQVLDSFATLPVFNGCSSLYRFKAPDLNMCLPPLNWQTYDIHFTSARWGANGEKLRNAHITVWQNGVKTQDNVELPNKTGAGKTEEPNLLPHLFQNHSDPVRFRNIWVIDRGLMHAAFPVYPKKTNKAKASEKSKKPAQASAAAKAKKQAELNAKLAEDARKAAMQAQKEAKEAVVKAQKEAQAKAQAIKEKARKAHDAAVAKQQEQIKKLLDSKQTKASAKPKQKPKTTATPNKAAPSKAGKAKQPKHETVKPNEGAK